MRALSGAAAVLCAGLLAACAVSPAFTIRTLAIEGAHHTSVDAITSASALVDGATFRASAARAREQVLRLPAVRDAVVEIVLPDRARVAIAERIAIGRWLAGGNEYFVDGDGVLFGSIDPRGAPDARVSDERAARRPGDRLDPALVDAAMKLARLRTEDLRADGASPRVVLTAGGNGLVLRTAAWEIRFGGAEHIDEKIATARRFLRENRERKLDYVDVRTPDSLVVSPR